MFSEIMFCISTGLLYFMLTYLLSPYKSIDLIVSTIFLIGGCLSVYLVLKFHYFFTDWGTVNSLDEIKINIDNNNFFTIKSNDFNSFFHYAFIKVSLLEEFMKLVTFFILTKFLSFIKTFNKNVFMVTFLMCSIGLSFATIENILYALNNGNYTILMRTFSSSILHFTCGSIMGYYIYKFYSNYKVGNKTVYDIILKRNPIVKKNNVSFL